MLLVGVSDIREGDDYPGIRVKLNAVYQPIRVPLTVDVTTGDIITPEAISFTYPLLFDARSIHVLAYNLETIMAEKIETILSRGVANTRPRDFYDVYILYTLHGTECDRKVLRQALEHTTAKRGSRAILTQYPQIIADIRKSDSLRMFWEKYQHEFEYAKEISFDEICDTLQRLMNGIIKEV